MGLVINISYCDIWKMTYFVQCMDESEAKHKAFKMFRDPKSFNLPDTLEEAEKDDAFLCEVVATVEQIIL